MAEYSLYAELAAWWPVISPPVEYSDDGAVINAIFASAARPVRTVLDLGSGGGHVALHVKDDRSMTLVDLSAEMLEVSKRLNPDCEHIEGDMRTIRLGRQFDAVLVHDAIDYVTSQHDLRCVIRTAFAHCRPGGLAIFAPDHTAETFRAGTGEAVVTTALAGRRASASGRRILFPMMTGFWPSTSSRCATPTARFRLSPRRTGSARSAGKPGSRCSVLPDSLPRSAQVPEPGTGPHRRRWSSSAAVIWVRRDAWSPAAQAVGAGRRDSRIAGGSAAAAGGVQ